MPAINTADFAWNCIGDLETQRFLFGWIQRNNEDLLQAQLFVCNSMYDLEPAAFGLPPGTLPIGPLLASNRHGKSIGNFWPEDSTCLRWVDNQSACSVIYVAFGSFTVFDETQFHELALGLELTNRPFLWVVRPDIITGKNGRYPEGFEERVGDRGMMVGWAPQQKVLSHPSIACFLSHCGWNSTMEGVSKGVPFLCWPYFADQFQNQGYICDVWKVGLGFNRDERGIVRKGEIHDRVNQLLLDEKLKARAMALKEMIGQSVMEGGSSYKNFKNFIEWMKS